MSNMTSVFKNGLLRAKLDVSIATQYYFSMAFQPLWHLNRPCQCCFNQLMLEQKH